MAGLGVGSLMTSGAFSVSAEIKLRRPNLLFIMTDQQRWDALSIAGNTVLKTPNLDRLARQGACFKNAYTPCAVCAPARSSILTGHTVEHTGMRTNGRAYHYREEGLMVMPTFDEILAGAGYHCEYYGKWHSQTSHTHIYKNPAKAAKNGRSIFDHGGQKFMHLDYLDVHAPRREPGQGELIDNMSERPYRTNPMDRFHGTPYADLKAAKIKLLQCDQHGELLMLRQHTLTAFQARQTLVIFTSDHGEMLGAHGMREKNVFYEESAHIPLIIRLPNRIKSNSTVQGYVSSVDLFATIMDYLDLEEHRSDGKSLRGLIEGTDTEHGKYVVTEWDYRGDVETNYMIVKDGWKLIIPYSTSSKVINAMYDLNTDHCEMNNLLGKNPDRDRYAEKAEELRACLLQWLRKNGSRHYEGVRDRTIV